MELTEQEESILNGELGSGLQLAMSLLVDVGEFFSASKLIPIGSAHISGVSYLTGGDGLIDQLKLFVENKAKVSVYSSLNPCGMDRANWESHYIDLDFATKQFEILSLFDDLGVVTTCSCTPYDFGHLLSKGQHVAWAESSAITFANSFFGAKTNKEDSLSVLASAITGKTPYYGFHLDENRIPNIRINVNTELSDYSDYSILGEIVGQNLKGKNYPYGAIPVFEGIVNPRPQDMKALGAALASFGTQLFHVDGITPEQELIRKVDNLETIEITKNMVEKTYEALEPPEDVNLAVIGCPNANIEEIKLVTELVKGRTLKPGKEFWLFSNSAQKAIAEKVGYIEILENAGVKFLVDTCPEVTPYDKSRFKLILTNSVKAQHYISAPSLNDIPTYLLPVRKCVEMIFN